MHIIDHVDCAAHWPSGSSLILALWFGFSKKCLYGTGVDVLTSWVIWYWVCSLVFFFFFFWWFWHQRFLTGVFNNHKESEGPLLHLFWKNESNLCYLVVQVFAELSELAVRLRTKQMTVQVWMKGFCLQEEFWWSWYRIFAPEALLKRRLWIL